MLSAFAMEASESKKVINVSIDLIKDTAEMAGKRSLVMSQLLIMEGNG